MVVLEGGLQRFSLGLVVGRKIPKGNSTLLISLQMRLLINGWEDWNSTGVKLRIEFEY